ncbi:MAG: DUF3370 domain-containing protein [Candidatus Sericytochromatia bacterium]|nr:DUF3370 domain-containing protein [Candidatus Sericytochromatia bacterium]
MRLQRRFLHLSLCLAAFVSALPAQAQSSEQIKSVQKMKVYPLPGSLDSQPMLNSNSPEIISEQGILVSTLPGPEGGPFLNYAFNGDFGLFSHHIAKDSFPGERLLYLGLLVTNQSNQTVRLTRKAGASYLSQPDALFKALPSFMANTQGKVYAGPGDRVTSELLAGKGLEREVIEIAPRSTQLVFSLPVPTHVAILPPINGRSTLMHFHSDGPVYLSHLAAYAKKEGGAFVPPTLENYRALLDQRQLAGTREQAPTVYEPSEPPPGGNFRYGRVAGVSEGVHWQGRFFEKTRILERPAPGETVAYPLSSLYLKRWGTAQNQSGQMLRRYPDSAYQSHANYGVRYDLTLPLHNESAQYTTYALGLSHPVSMSGNPANAEMTYLYPPNKPVMFRGSVRLNWVDEYRQQQDQIHHLVLRHGEETAPLSLITVPPGVQYDLKLSLFYPADCTAPQLLTLRRIE